MVHAIDAARFFVNIANTIPTDDLMTNMRVNKLLYFAQGECLRKLGKPLFDDDMEAWDYGPVVPPVYQTYKGFGREPIKDGVDYQDTFSEQEKMSCLMYFATMDSFPHRLSYLCRMRRSLRGLLRIKMAISTLPYQKNRLKPSLKVSRPSLNSLFPTKKTTLQDIEIRTDI